MKGNAVCPYYSVQIRYRHIIAAIFIPERRLSIFAYLVRRCPYRDLLAMSEKSLIVPELN